MVDEQEQPSDRWKRGPGGPRTKQWPDPLNVGAGEVARLLFGEPHKKDYRYGKEETPGGDSHG